MGIRERAFAVAGRPGANEAVDVVERRRDVAPRLSLCANKKFDAVEVRSKSGAGKQVGHGESN